VGLALTAVSVGCLLAVGLLGESVAVPPLGEGSPLPLRLDVDPGPWHVVALLALAYAAAAGATALGLLAVHRGWRPDGRRLLTAGALAVLALVLTPPFGSADHLSYAAYGRIALAGDDPYVEAPGEWRGGTDPVAGGVLEPWRWAPSVYGPVATAEHALAAALGGDSLAATVWWLSAFGGLAFVLTAMMLLRVAGADPAARARAVLLFGLNPLLLGAVVSGAHVDGLAVMFGVAGLVALRRSPLLAGVLLGCAVGTKLSCGLLGLAAVWGLRSQARLLLRLAVGAALVLLPGHAVAGSHAFDQVRRAARFVSLASPWHLLDDEADVLLGTAARPLIGLAALSLGALVTLALWRLLPPARSDDPLPRSVRAAVVLAGAWLLTSPYSLPWYDVMLWAPLALLPGSALDVLALVRTFSLALAYIPGLVALPDHVRTATLTWRGSITPWIGLALVVLVIAWSVTPQGDQRASRFGDP
jgi:hypothetical protein